MWMVDDQQSVYYTALDSSYTLQWSGISTHQGKFLSVSVTGKVWMIQPDDSLFIIPGTFFDGKDNLIFKNINYRFTCGAISTARFVAHDK